MESNLSIVDPSEPDLSPDRPPTRSMLLVAAALVAGGLVGYVVGASAAGDDPDPQESFAATGAEPTTPNDEGLGGANGATPAEGTSALDAPLTELVPGWNGRLSVVLQRGSELELVELGQASPRTTILPVDTWVERDITGRLYAGIGGSALAGSMSPEMPAGTLYVGTAPSMWPAALEVRSFAWHHTAPGSIAWLESGDDGTLLLRTAVVNAAGMLTLHGPIASIPTGASPGLVTWNTWGFLLAGWDESTGRPFTYLLDPDGEERWRRDDVSVFAWSSEQVLLSQFDENGESIPELLVMSVASVADEPPTPLEWDLVGGSGEQVTAAAWSPDGDRLAFIVMQPDWRQGRIEVRRGDGSVEGSTDLFGQPWSLHWSADGRFVLAAHNEQAAAGRNMAMFYDTVDDVRHEVEFDAPVQQVLPRS